MRSLTRRPPLPPRSAINPPPGRAVPPPVYPASARSTREIARPLDALRRHHGDRAKSIARLSRLPAIAQLLHPLVISGTFSGRLGAGEERFARRFGPERHGASGH